jgi:poly-gamma-glutamate synthesis protein (capsule biosynthesis protein)
MVLAVHPGHAQTVPGSDVGNNAPHNGPDALNSPPLDKSKAMAMKIPGSFDFVAAGDLIDLHPIAQRTDPDIQATLKIIRDADAAAANMEANIADFHHYTGSISDHTGEAVVAADVKSMGFDILSRANNHATDEGIGIMFETARNLEAQGLVYAGTGRNLGEARAPQFVELPKGRIGMEAMLSVGVNGGAEGATYAYSSDPGLPGVNLLHLTTYHTVSQQQLDDLRKMRDDTYTHRTDFSNPVPPLPGNEPKDVLNFWGTLYKAGDVPGGLSYRMNADDEREILRAVRNGKELSDYMVVLIHSHEDNSLLQTLFLSENPPEFLVKFAHAAIDNGADVFIGTGPHVLRGVEIYHGKPIFYGLSSLVNYWSTGRPPLSAYMLHHLNPFNTEYTGTDLDYDGAAFRLAIPIDFDSMFGECKYQDGKLTEVILHPIDQGYALPQADRGTPRAAHGEAAQRILQHVQDISKQFGTKIDIEGEVGVIHVAADTADK